MDIMKRTGLAVMAMLAMTASVIDASQGSSGWSGTSSTYAYQGSGCCPEPVCCEDMCGRFFVRGDLLYFVPHQTGLELDFGTASISQSVTDGVQTTNSTEYDTDPGFKWNPGYRIAAGYVDEASKWGLGAIWTHYQSSASRSNQEDESTFNHGKWRVKWDQIDVVVAYDAHPTPSFNVKPFVGVRGARIHQSLNAVLVTDLTLSPPPTTPTSTRTFDDSQNYRAIGPVFGFESDFEVGCGFGFYGTAAASVLYGKTKVSYDDSDIFTAPVSKNFYNLDRRHVDSVDCNIDLALGLRWHTRFCDDFELDLRLGAEHHQFFNQGRLGVSHDDLSFDGGVFSVELSY